VRGAIFLFSFLLSAALPVCGQEPLQMPSEETPPTQQKRFYADAKPYLLDALPDLPKAIPELHGLDSAATQQDLPGLLASVGEEIQGLLAQMPNLICREEVKQSVVPRMPSLDSRPRQFNYLILCERKRAEQDLRIAHDNLEKRVMERTLELQQKNIQILKQSETLEVANRGLRELSSRLLRVQDDERRRIARELHDSTGQVLALLSMNLSALEDEVKEINAEIGKSLSENVEIVNQVSGELRTISYLLHPPLLDEVGLLSALRWFAEGFEERSKIKVNLELDSEFGRVSRDLETAIFRVVQESLTNIHRHADSATATIRLAQSGDRVTLEIEDAGKGIAPGKLYEITSAGVSGVGLRGMRERIENFRGQFDVTSGQKGTCIRVVIPIAALASLA